MKNPLRYFLPRKSTGPLFASSTPQTTRLFPDVSQGFTAIVQIAKDILINPDIAYRQNRLMSEQMIRDPMITGPLTKRMLAVAQLDWEVVPEDEDVDPDGPEMQLAKEVEAIIRMMPKRTDFFKDLLWGIWRGTGVSEVDWKFDHRRRQWVPCGHRPHNGDKITYDKWGTPRILTRENQHAGRELTEAERDRLVIHVYDPDDGSFYEGAEAGYIFKGRGLRDQTWHYWWLKHNALRFWLQFMERYGGGFAIGRYPQGNKEAKDAIESVLRNLINDSKVSLPVPPGAGDKESYGIEIVTVQAAAQNARLFQEFVDGWAGKHIRILIEGQEQAQQESGDGLGSGRAKALQDMFRSYVKYDAVSLGDTLTSEFVEKIVRYNYGSLPYALKFRFIVEEDDYEENAKRVTAAKEAGLVVPKNWVYETLDIPRPKPDEEVIDFGAQAMAGMGIGMDPSTDPAAGEDASLFSPESFEGPEVQQFADALVEALEWKPPQRG